MRRPGVRGAEEARSGEKDPGGGSRVAEDEEGRRLRCDGHSGGGSNCHFSGRSNGEPVELGFNPSMSATARRGEHRGDERSGTRSVPC